MATLTYVSPPSAAPPGVRRGLRRRRQGRPQRPRLPPRPQRLRRRPITVTVLTPGNDKYGQARPDIAVAVPATTGERLIGPFPADLADPADGLVAITYSGVTSLTVAAVTL
jgi:hypothetical protein